MKPKCVCPSTVVTNQRELSQLQMADEDHGDGNKITTVEEYDAFLAKTTKGPLDPNSPEAALRARLHGLEEAGRKGVRLRGGHKCKNLNPIADLPRKERREFRMADPALEGVGPTMEPWEDGIRQSTGKGNVEWWYFDAQFADESGQLGSVVINFMTKRIMKPKSDEPKLEITVTLPGKKPEADFTMHKKEDFAAATDRCEVTIGDSFIRGDLEVYTVHAKGDIFEIDLEFTRVAPSWRPGPGKMYFDEEAYMGWVVPIPHGIVKGTIKRLDTGDVTVVNGDGYHDHNWSNTSLSKVYDHWYWGRSHEDDTTALFFRGVGKGPWKGEEMDLFMLAQGDETLVASGEGMKLTTGDFVRPKEPGRREYPTAVGVSVPGDYDVSIFMTDPKILEREDLLADVPWVLRGLARLFLDPRYTRFESRQRFFIERKDGTVTNVGGDMIYELMEF